MANSNIPKVDGNFKLDVVSSSQTFTDTLYTDNKAISGDIVLNITAKTGTASIDGVTITPTFSRSGNVITVTGSETVTGGVTPGWIDSISSGNVNVSGSYSIPLATTATITSAFGTRIWNVTPSTSDQRLKITAGYIGDSDIKVSGAASFNGKYTM